MGATLSCFGPHADENGLLSKPKYVLVGELGSSKTGSTMKLMKLRKTDELVAVKFVERMAGAGLSKSTEREIINHRKLLHPNIIRFREVFLTDMSSEQMSQGKAQRLRLLMLSRFREVFMTDTHLCIVMEYAQGGHLSSRISTNGKLPEAEARRFFQQLISGVQYCHEQGVFHRDLRLENLMLDGNFFTPNLKISGFGECHCKLMVDIPLTWYSKSSILDSQPKTNVGSPAYTPPELLLAVKNGAAGYDAALTDVWSCGVILYIMLFGVLPFSDPTVPNALTRKMMQRIVNVDYSFPANVQITPECQDLVRRIFVADPMQRIKISAILQHPWIRGVPLPKMAPVRQSSQSVEEIRTIVEQARQRRLAQNGRGPEPGQQQHHQQQQFNEDLIEEDN